MLGKQKIGVAAPAQPALPDGAETETLQTTLSKNKTFESELYSACPSLPEGGERLIRSLILRGLYRTTEPEFQDPCPETLSGF